MTLLHALPMLMLLADPAPEPGWEQAAKDDGITVLARERKESGLREMKATGTFEATPEEVWKVLRDYDSYAKVMPYTQVSKVVGTEEGGKVTHFYTVLTLPLIDRRDYTLRIVDESDWKDGKGFLKSSWTVSDKGPAPQKDIVRVSVNTGYWKLEPVDGGKKTFGTYYLYTDPGGGLPRWIVNTANGTAVPDVFKTIRREVVKRKQAQK